MMFVSVVLQNCLHKISSLCFSQTAAAMKGALLTTGEESKPPKSPRCFGVSPSALHCVRSVFTSHQLIEVSFFLNGCQD